MNAKQTPRERAVLNFWDDQTLIKIADAPANFWDDCNWWQKMLLVCVAVVICFFVGGLVAAVLVPK